MRDERVSRRPVFRSGLGLRLADGQVWSLPVPGETIGDVGGPGAGWDDSSYKAILRAVNEAEDQGELFRAELALAIHLVRWNYAIDGDDLGELFDDQIPGRARVDIADALRELTLAHVGPVARPFEVGRRGLLGIRKDEVLRLIGTAASRMVGRRGTGDAEGSADLTA